MKKMTVRLGTRSHDVHIGWGIANQAAKLLKRKPSKAFILADRTLPKYTKTLQQGLVRAGWEVHVLAVPADEKIKDLQQLFPIFGKLLKAKADRHSVVFALGGGAIGDAAGFVAATYMRGIDWVSVPTTLLSQVDSGLGGKTAVNHPEGKNLIGAFHQPKLIICDTSFLSSLPQREIVSGLGEVIKYGLIFDKKFFSYCEKNWTKALKLDKSTLEKMVARSLLWKSKTVEKDERDLSGLREKLNFGHTLGHALEAHLGYGKIRHGEAILWGMLWASRLSRICGKLSDHELTRIELFIGSLPLTSLPKKLSAKNLQPYLRNDKKTKDGKATFVLLDGIGKTTRFAGVTTELIESVISGSPLHSESNDLLL